jgi:hypothetical protein
MNHFRYAPETGLDEATAPEASFGDPIPANFSYTRVKQQDATSAELGTDVPCDITAGVTAQYRVFRMTAEPKDLSVDCQIAPDNDPMPPLIPDQAETDPYLLKESYIGKITVHQPDGKTRTFKVTTDRHDRVPVDLTQGVEIRCSFDFSAAQTNPIGPLFDIDVTPSGP